MSLYSLSPKAGKTSKWLFFFSYSWLFMLSYQIYTKAQSMNKSCISSKWKVLLNTEAIRSRPQENLEIELLK